MNLQSGSLRNHPIGHATVTDAAALLAALQAAHRQIEAASTDLEDVSAAGAPDVAKFSMARLRLGQAHLARRPIAQKVYAVLVSTISADEAEAVRDLQRRDGELAQELSDHIRRWTPIAVQERWAAYCEASVLIRGRLRAVLAMERSLIFPLLKRLA